MISLPLHVPFQLDVQYRDQTQGGEWLSDQMAAAVLSLSSAIHPSAVQLNCAENFAAKAVPEQPYPLLPIMN